MDNEENEYQSKTFIPYYDAQELEPGIKSELIAVPMQAMAKSQVR